MYVTLRLDETSGNLLLGRRRQRRKRTTARISKTATPATETPAIRPALTEWRVLGAVFVGELVPLIVDVVDIVEEVVFDPGVQFSAGCNARG